MLKARRLVAEQAMAEQRVLPLARSEDVELALAIDARIAVDLSERFAAEAKAVHVELVAGAGPEAAVARLAAAGLTSSVNTKDVPTEQGGVLSPRAAPGGPAAEWPAPPPVNAKGVDLGELTRTYAAVLVGPAGAELDAVPDPLPLRAVPPTDEQPAVRPLPPVPAPRPAIAGMRFTWTTEE